MPSKPKTTKLTASPTLQTPDEKMIRVRIRALEIPPIKDCLLIGVDAAIGGEAMVRTLRLMTHERFDRILLKDDIIQEVIVRGAVLRKIGREQLLGFIEKRVKPIMAESELLLLDIEVEVVMEHVL